MQRESGWGHTSCRCESEEGGEGEYEGSGEHCLLLLDWWKWKKLVNCCEKYHHLHDMSNKLSQLVVLVMKPNVAACPKP